MFLPSIVHADKLKETTIQNQIRIIAKDLKCLVCEGQSVHDSDAQFAIDVRNQIRKNLEKGLQENEIKDLLVKEYGVEILYTPPTSQETWILWYGPYFMIGLIFLAILIMRLRGQK